MATISSTLTHDHRSCDELYANAEEAAARSDWATARPLAKAFDEAMKRHLGYEEEVLFAEFEARTGMSGGPVAVMRMEHAQMRELLASMAAAAEAGDTDAYLGAGETLVMVMQQHNFKEENILYRMMDAQLGDPEALLARFPAT